MLEKGCFPPFPEGPDYPVVPLKHDEIRVAVIQMNPKPVDEKDPQRGIEANLNHMLDLCDAAVVWPPHPMGVQLIAFPEFTLTGFDTRWTRDDWLKVAIHCPNGPEIERIGQKARELNCYIAFATHTQDPDEWPGHFFNNSIIVSPEGKVVHMHWKAYYGFPGCAEFSTCAHDVLAQFIERYGQDALWPVARTDIGNIGTFICSQGFAPETARVLAMQGAEILIRHIANGGASYVYEFPFVGMGPVRMRSDCMANHAWGIYADSRGNHLRISGAAMVENGMGGGSMLIDPYGRVLQQAVDSTEHVLHTIVPIASYRRKHTVPRIRTELYLPVYEKVRGPVPPNLMADYLPKDLADAARWSAKHLRTE